MSSRITIAGYEFLGPYPLGTFQAPNEAAIYLILKTSLAFPNNYEAYYVGHSIDLRRRIEEHFQSGILRDLKDESEALRQLCYLPTSNLSQNEIRELESKLISILKPNRNIIFRRYFDLNVQGKANTIQIEPTPVQKEPAVKTYLVKFVQVSLSAIDQLLLYFGCIVGVLFSTFLDQYKEGSLSSIDISWPSLIISSVVAIAIFPFIYGKLPRVNEAAYLVRFGLCVQNGLFWKVLLDAHN